MSPRKLTTLNKMWKRGKIFKNKKHEKQNSVRLLFINGLVWFFSLYESKFRDYFGSRNGIENIQN